MFPFSNLFISYFSTGYPNFSVISNSYDAFIIDLWGVMHNGIRLNSGAIEVVENLSKNRKRILVVWIC